MTIKVLIVDDSLLIRQIFEDILSSDSDIEVVGTANDPFEAREKIKALNPDIITLDIEMPKMDGITFLEKIMTLRPMPVLMVSTLTHKGAEATLRALELGAVDYIGKPTGENQQDIYSIKHELIEKVKMVAKARVRALPKQKKNEVLHLPAGKIKTKSLVAIGSSTGGVEALREVLTMLPKNMPPIVIVQHMPPKFTKSFAERMDGLCELTVHEATNNQPILAGNVYIAPGGKHMKVEKEANGYVCKVKEGENVSGHCPSVDVLFDSVSKMVGDKAVGCILTGMGKDGASGMLKMKNTGCFNIGQDEKTCVVYGMPKEAFLNGSVDIELPLGQIAQEIIKQCTS
jgi:two-component system chemotaxis response regulator CheB